LSIRTTQHLALRPLMDLIREGFWSIGFIFPNAPNVDGLLFPWALFSSG